MKLLQRLRSLKTWQKIAIIVTVAVVSRLLVWLYVMYNP